MANTTWSFATVLKDCEGREIGTLALLDNFIQDTINSKVAEAVAAERKSCEEYIETEIEKQRMMHGMEASGYTEEDFKRNKERGDELFRGGKEMPEQGLRSRLAALLQQYVAEAADREREACAKLLLGMYEKGSGKTHTFPGFEQAWGSGVLDAADAIQAIGKPKIVYVEKPPPYDIPNLWPADLQQQIGVGTEE